jgi:hypothetical protein
MKTPRTPLALSLVAIAALFAVPVAATAAEAVVPPSNSAAAQYTEAFPTSGGDKKTEGAAHHRSPAKVLGSHKAKKLEKQGPEGKAAAEVAAATAPASVAAPPSGGMPSTQSTSSNGHKAGDGGSGSKSGAGAGNGGSGTPDKASDAAGGTGTVQSPAPNPTGSSGIGSAIGQATGLSTVGPSGLLLLLVIVATVLWSLAYLWRQRRQVG